MTPSCSPVLVYNRYGIVKVHRFSVFLHLPSPLFLYTADIVLPSTAASACPDSLLLPVFVYSWHCLAKYNRIIVSRLLPPPLSVYTADYVLPSTAASVCSDSCRSHVLVYSWHFLAKYCRISGFLILYPRLFLYTADMVLPSTAASVFVDSSLLTCSCIQLTFSCQVLPHQWLNTTASSPVLVYSWHCLDKYCRIGVHRLLPHPLFLYTAGIVLPSTAASVCSDSSLLPCSCIQLTLSCQVLI